jgi:pilus assembly protein CpaE
MTVLKDSISMSARHDLSFGEPLSVVGLCLDEETRRFLDLMAGAAPLFRVRSHIGSYRAAQDQDAKLDQLGDPAPDVCLVDFDHDRRSAAMMAERIHSTLPGVALFAVSSKTHPDAILEAMRCGCSEYLSKPLDREQVVSALVRIEARRKERLEQSRAQLLAFMGAKGGCGVTALASQMGALLASAFSRNTLLIDLHPDFGDAALYLKLTKARYHFFELLENIDRLDADFLQCFLMKHPSGLDLIPAPEGSVKARDGSPAGALSQTLDFLRLRYEFILVDLPPSLNAENLTVIQGCDQLYLVTVAEVAAVRNVVRQLEYFSQRGIPREKIRVVLNRDHKSNAVTPGQIEKVIEQKIFWRVPNQYPQVVKTIHEGDPMAQLSSSEVTRSLKEWAETIGKKAGTETRKKEGGGFLGLWNR